MKTHVDCMPAPVTVTTPHPRATRPEGQEPLADADCLALETGTTLDWPALPCPSELVLASAFNSGNPCRLHLESPEADFTHELDADFTSHGQRYHIELPAGVGSMQVSACDGQAALWIIAHPERVPGGGPAVWNLCSRRERQARYFQRLDQDGIAQFGWMGGCVLEAYDALARVGDRSRWESARDRWWNIFLTDGRLHYQDPRGRPINDAFNSIETPLPIASLARKQPDHPIIAIAIDYLRRHPRNNQTCEGCYTAAYPLMQVACSRSESALADLAYTLLAERREALYHDGAIYLRYIDDQLTYRDWARGIAWYLLGHAECLRLTGCEGRWAPVAEHITGQALRTLGRQRDDGLWSNFLDEPELPADTAGSAGIAAALLLLRDLGLLDTEATVAAQRCWDGLLTHLHADGWPGGTSPSNKRGEAAQHTDRRACETFGLGLMGRLAAALTAAGASLA